MPNRAAPSGPWLADVDPTPSEDRAHKYTNGDQWVNTTTPSIWQLVDHDTGDWKQVYPATGSGPSPSGTVTTETAFGQSSSAGVAATYSRGDHTHGTPATPTASDVGAVPTARTISTTAPLTGGGDLSANRTLAVSNATTGAVGVVQLATPSSDTTAGHVVQASDARLSDSRAPTGSAGGDLSGTYPNPSISSSVITTAARTVLDDSTVAAMLTTLGGAPNSPSYVTLATSSDLTSERVLTAGTGISVIDAGAGSTVTIAATTGNTATRYDPDAAPSSPTYVTPTQEFERNQSAGGWTNVFDPASAGVLTHVIGDPGLVLTTTSPGTNYGMQGVYHSTFPSGDFTLWTAVDVWGHRNKNIGGIGFAQGSGSTDDIYFVGQFHNTGVNESTRNAWSNYMSAYNSIGGVDRYFQTFAGRRLYICVRYNATTKKVTTFIGRSPTHMVCIDIDFALTSTPTLLMLLVSNGSTDITQAVFPFLRVISETYSASETVFPTVLSGARVTDH